MNPTFGPTRRGVHRPLPKETWHSSRGLSLTGTASSKHSRCARYCNCTTNCSARASFWAPVQRERNTFTSSSSHDVHLPTAFARRFCGRITGRPTPDHSFERLPPRRIQPTNSVRTTTRMPITVSTVLLPAPPCVSARHQWSPPYWGYIRGIHRPLAERAAEPPTRRAECHRIDRSRRRRRRYRAAVVRHPSAGFRTVGLGHRPAHSRRAAFRRAQSDDRGIDRSVLIASRNLDDGRSRRPARHPLPHSGAHHRVHPRPAGLTRAR